MKYLYFISIINIIFAIFICIWIVKNDSKSVQRDIQQLDYIKDQYTDIKELLLEMDTVQKSVIQLEKIEIEKMK